MDGTHRTVDVSSTDTPKPVGIDQFGTELIIGLISGFVALTAIQILLVMIGIRFYKNIKKGGLYCITSL